MHITTLPYHPPSIPGTSFKRIIVKPIAKEEKTTEEGLLIPTDVGKLCEIGLVTSTCEDSEIKSGDTVLYSKVDRTSKEHLDTVEIEGETYDFLYENEVWAVNNQPFNRIFVAPLSSLQINDSGLILPEGTKGNTQKGKVFRSPSHYTIKADDNIEYRAEEGVYPSIEIEGGRYDILNEWDVFIVNDHVAPFRIIVEIDMAAQRLKRNTADSGLLRSQLFQFMLFNMQCGKVMEIGEEAQKNYPELQVGDTAILHHRIESDKYRLLKQVEGKHAVAYEYRVINAFDTTSREIFGRIANRKEKVFVPFGKNIFLEWNFDVMEEFSKTSGSLFLDFENNLDKCHAIDDFNSTLKHKTDEGFAKGMAKIKGTIQVLSKLKLPEQKDKYDQLESELNLAKQESAKVGYSLNKNHLLICKKLGSNEKIIAPYRELYPINILGKKFLIGYEDYIIATLT